MNALASNRSLLLSCYLFLALFPFSALAVKSSDFHGSVRCGENSKIHPVHVLKAFGSRSTLQCADQCDKHVQCKSFDFDKDSRKCTLGLQPFYTDCSNSVVNGTNYTTERIKHFDQVFPLPACLNGGTAVDSTSCLCPNGAVGDRCERFVADCEDWHRLTRETGQEVKWIKPPESPTAFQVNCKLDTPGKSKLFIMTRTLGTNVEFERDWVEFQDGFGDLEGDFWLGLENLHALTAGDQRYTLKVLIEVKRSRDNFYETYEDFRVSDESDDYRLSLTPNAQKDCLSPLNGFPFGTRDRDNDGVPAINCARRRGGSWWWWGKDCSVNCNPVGRMLDTGSGNQTGKLTDASWLHWSPLGIKMYLMLPE